VAQGVQAGRGSTNGARHARTERYRGRHRKAGARIGFGTGVRVAATVACAALFVCLPQPSWANRASAGTVAGTVAGTGTAHATTSQVTVRSLPGRLRLICATRLG
jgi:hypothetical protein